MLFCTKTRVRVSFSFFNLHYAIAWCTKPNSLYFSLLTARWNQMIVLEYLVIGWWWSNYAFSCVLEPCSWMDFCISRWFHPSMIATISTDSLLSYEVIRNSVHETRSKSDKRMSTWHDENSQWMRKCRQHSRNGFTVTSISSFPSKSHSAFICDELTMDSTFNMGNVLLLYKIERRKKS